MLGGKAAVMTGYERVVKAPVYIPNGASNKKILWSHYDLIKVKFYSFAFPQTVSADCMFLLYKTISIVRYISKIGFHHVSQAKYER